MPESNCPSCSRICNVDDAHIGHQVGCPYCGELFDAGVERRSVMPLSAAKTMKQEIDLGQMTISSYMNRHNLEGGVELENQAHNTAGTSSVIQTEHGDKYTIGGVVAQGGMGAILSVKDLNCRRSVAMKVMLSDTPATTDTVLRFIEEAQITAQLEHPNIVPVHELGVDASGGIFYTMKMVRGTTLADILTDLSQNVVETVQIYTLQRLLTIFMRVCDAVAFANSKGVIHRDLKPANIMVGEFGEVLVMDWGLAKVLGRDENKARIMREPDHEVPEWRIDSVRHDGIVDTRNTMQGDILGTPAFMAPEQAAGEIDQMDTRTDIYALGGVLYNILTLEAPIKSAPIQVMLNKLARGEIKPPSIRASKSKLPHLANGQIPRALSAVAMKALALHQQDRYQTVGDLQREIEAWQGGFATLAEDASFWQQVRLGLGRHKKEVALISVAMVILTVGTAIAFWRVNSAKRDAEKNAIIAQQNADEAREARNHSELSLAEAQRSNYISQIALAQANIDNGNYDAARSILDSCPKEHIHFEWYRLVKLCNLGDQIFKGHRDLLDSVTFSPDGSQILTSSHDGSAKLWNTQTGLVLQTFRDEYRIRIRSAALSPDGKLVLTGNYDSAVTLWDAASGRQIRTFSGHLDAIETVAFSPDGNRIATGSHDGTARIWDAEIGMELRTFPVKSKVNRVGFSPDGKMLLVASPEMVRLFDVDSGRELRSFAHQSCFSAVFSRDGREILTGAYMASIRWDASTGEKLLSYPGVGVVFSAVFSPDGKQLVTTTETEVVVFDTATGSRLRVFKPGQLDRCSVAFSVSGKEVLTGGKHSAILWDVDTGKEIRRYDGWLKGEALKNLDTQKVRTLKGHGKWAWTANFSPDGSKIVSGAADGTVRIWDARNGSQLQELAAAKGYSGYVWFAKFSPDGRKILTGDHTNGAASRPILWDAATASVLKTMAGHQAGTLVRDAAFSPDGTMLITGSDDTTAKLWEAATGREIRTLKGHTAAIRSVDFSPDGKQVLTGSFDKTLKVWDVESGNELLSIMPGGAVYSVAFSPDGKQILTGTSHPMAKLWDASSGQLLRSLKGHSMTVATVAFSPDGARIVTGSADNTAKLWDTATGKELITFSGHTEAINQAVFSRDGKHIVTASADFTVKVWSQN